MHPALTAQSLSITAGTTGLVHDLSFHVDPGERVALLGASGSGKSLTAAAILGSLAPGIAVAGEITLFGTARPTRTVRGRGGSVAAVYQDSLSALNPLVSVGGQLIATLRAQSRRVAGRTATRDARGTVADLLESVGIDDPQRTMRGYPAELSGGQRQRVCIALALLCQARLLIADEPTTALDVVTQARVIEVLRDYGQVSGAAILFITHDLAVAASLCDRALVLENGRLVESASMADLIGRPQHPYSRALVAAATPARDLVGATQ
ncbi:peptide ABC transporter ATP-binding protein [Cryobacterium sp. LW097]|uniref:ATP-binding cassette domain-containing protein n=1 Tax=Cryobacterium sp. LW097 TaxID=1978566 RepID=UPI000B4C52E3|nr:ABC transporter ATP-binding protein [Cryobacterium sp. LW097]ASD20992.1 peptide ABC transporter ATP-binding protein [Cryobacterium sp. LW097]